MTSVRDGFAPTSARACVVTLATDHKQFAPALERLEESLQRVGFGGDFVAWRPGDYPANCPAHLDVPFAFKPFCFMEARRRGYCRVLWLDAACVAVRSIDPWFERLDARGYVLFSNGGRSVGEWAGDDALDALGVERAQAMRIPEVNAAALGLDLGSELGAAFLERWYAAAVEGVAFRGTRRALESWQDYHAVKWNHSGRVSSDARVRGHRHDQTVAGVLAHRLGMRLSARGLQPYSHDKRYIPWRARVIVDRDAGQPRGPATLRTVERDKYLGRLFGRRTRDDDERTK